MDLDIKDYEELVERQIGALSNRLIKLELMLKNKDQMILALQEENNKLIEGGKK